MTSAFESDTVLFNSQYFLAISNVLVRQRHQQNLQTNDLKKQFEQAQDYLRQDSFDKNCAKQFELARLIEQSLKKHGARTFGNLCQYKYINEFSRNQIRFVLNAMIHDGKLQTTAKHKLTEENCPRHLKFWVEGYKKNQLHCNPAI
jgi:hypothetical protein